ncbi:MAG: hypothetical protein V1884_01885 [Candidatus Omnitrophota bacterium]
MLKEAALIFGLLSISIFPLPLVYSQTDSLALTENSIVSVEGRLAVEKHGQEEWLVLHAKDAQTYLVTGNFSGKLKNTLLELGKKNLVSLTGILDGKSNISCAQSSQYEYNEKGERILITDTACIRYYHLGVTQIDSTKTSDEKMPPAQRYADEERRMSANRGTQGLTPLITGEIYGKITSANLRSPIKTITVANQDKDSPIESITLIITAGTRIVEKIGEKEPLALRTDALKTGQNVTAVFSKDELKNEALLITITKE